MNKGFKTYLVILASMISWFILMNVGPIWEFVKRVIKILLPFVYGGIFAYIFNPVNKYIKSKFSNEKLGKLIGVAVCVVLLAGSFIILVVLILPGFVQSVNQISASSSFYINKLTEFFQSEQLAQYLAISNEKITKWLADNIIPYITSISSTGLDLVGTIVNALFSLFNVAKNIIIGIFVMVYILLDGERMQGHISLVLNKILKDNKDDFDAILVLLDNAFSLFIRGKLLDSLIIGILCFIATSITKMPYALLISVIVGITNIIPFFGPFIGAIPSTLLILMNNPTKALIFVAIIVVLQQFDGNFLGPKILGDKTGLSPFWVLFSIILCGGLFGIVGMIIGVPLFSVLSTVIGVWLDNEQLKEN